MLRRENLRYRKETRLKETVSIALFIISLRLVVNVALYLRLL
jgi:hypothetical protein